MKKMLKLAIAALGALVVVAIALPFLIPVETVKQEVIRQVKEKTGRELAIGSVAASGFPHIGVTLTDVSLSNRTGFTNKPMLTAEKVVVGVNLSSLLSGGLEISSVALTRPAILLEVNRAGANNWQLGARAATLLPVADAGMFLRAAHAAENPLEHISIGDVRVDDGTVWFNDQRAGKKYELRALDLAFSMPSMRAPLSAKGKASMNGESLAFDVSMKTPHAWLQGEEAAVNIKISGAPLSLAFGGTAKGQAAVGKTVLEIPSVPALVKFTGGKPSAGGPQRVKVEGNAGCSATRCAIKNGSYHIDAIALAGDLTMDFAGAVPTVSGALKADTIDLTPYMATAQSGFPLVSEAYAAEGWSRENMDFSGLRAANANLSVALAKLVAKQFVVEDITSTVRINSGVLTLEAPRMKLYGGSGRVTATLNGNGTPAVHKQVALSGMDGEAFLGATSGMDRITGTLNVTMDVTGQGSSQAAIMQSLGGNASVQFLNGAIKGVNLAEMIRNAQATFTGAAATSSGTQQTDFAELGGTFAIQQGVATNHDLLMRAPLLRLKGDGTIDLGQRALHYRLVPELVGTLKGQGGKDKSGLAVPVRVDGPWENPSIRPDLESVAREALTNPEVTKEKVEAVKEQIKQGKDALKDLKSNPNAVNNLLKGLR